MKWNIISDSSCDIYALDAPQKDVAFSVIPFQLNIGDKVYTDDDDLDVSKMMKDMYACKQAVSSACASPSQWEEEFLKADMSIAVTITSSLSGSNSSANVAARNVLAEHPEKRIFVLDSLSAGGEVALIVREIDRLISTGLSFDEVVAKIKVYANKARLIFALSRFSNLIKTVRMNKLTGYAAELISIKSYRHGQQRGQAQDA